ncbi:MAG: 16S rRNA (guanine(527)-N(7))-methyltransferase RsmG [Synergistaceae bacterium]|jgi:16S rRNA (guanine527-N7)-methyltransferase|nr:16S rRNA (guanine(527)-N(7))-methyltransferase RsmG [Synergistaceae bacterium]
MQRKDLGRTNDVTDLELSWEDPLRRYAELLASYSAARLTGSREAKELYDLHVKDSLHSVPLLPETGRIVDVGSGGGLPGLVWAICRPDLAVTLLDSSRKKCRALLEMAAALNLENVSVVWERCEEHALSARERYALASARAVAHVGVLAEYLSPLVPRGGCLLAFKGPRGAEELAEVESKEESKEESKGGNKRESKWQELGLSPPQLLPYGPRDRNYFFVLWEKTLPCPSCYPRRPGLALSKHWWKG